MSKVMCEEQLKAWMGSGMSAQKIKELVGGDPAAIEAQIAEQFPGKPAAISCDEWVAMRQAQWRDLSALEASVMGRLERRLEALIQQEIRRLKPKKSSPSKSKEAAILALENAIKSLKAAP
jgi:hypothetical protein